MALLEFNLTYCAEHLIFEVMGWMLTCCLSTASFLTSLLGSCLKQCMDMHKYDESPHNISKCKFSWSVHAFFLAGFWEAFQKHKPKMKFRAGWMEIDGLYFLKMFLKNLILRKLILLFVDSLAILQIIF